MYKKKVTNQSTDFLVTFLSERNTRFELATFGLGSQRSTN